MPSFATRAIISAHNSALAAQGETVTYRRGDQAIENLRVLCGKSEAEACDKMGLVTTIEIQDFLILRSSLVLNGQPLTPERGDIVELDSEGVVKQFAVHHPDGNAAVYRGCDVHRTVLRIHTLLVEES